MPRHPEKNKKATKKGKESAFGGKQALPFGSKKTEKTPKKAKTKKTKKKVPSKRRRG